MSQEKKIWNEQQDELELLTLEISEVKCVLREVSQQISRIDRRVRAALPSSESLFGKNPPKCLETKETHTIVTELTKRARAGEQIEHALTRMNVKGELSVLARELGMTNKKLPPKHDLVRRIATRIRQRASVQASIHEGAEANTKISA